MGEGNNLVGVDIGSSSIKVCQVKETRKGLVLQKIAVAEVPSKTIVDGQVLDAASIVAALKGLFSKSKIRQRDVGVSVSGQSVIIRKITVPMMTAAELDEQIQWEAEQHIPFDIKDVQIDYQVLRRRPEDGQMDLLLVAAKRDQISDYAKLARDAKLRPIICDIDAFALQNLFELSRGLPPETIALLNVGASLTSLNIVSSGVSAFTREIVNGGSYITEHLEANLEISREQAEQVKCGATGEGLPTREQAQPIIDAACDTIAGEIQRSIDFFVATSGQEAITRIFLTGGSANLPVLAQAIERRSGVTVEVWAPIEAFTIDSKSVQPELLERHAAQLGVALGLSLRKSREARS